MTLYWFNLIVFGTNLIAAIIVWTCLKKKMRLVDKERKDIAEIVSEVKGTNQRLQSRIRQSTLINRTLKKHLKAAQNLVNQINHDKSEAVLTVERMKKEHEVTDSDLMIALEKLEAHTLSDELTKAVEANLHEQNGELRAENVQLEKENNQYIDLFEQMTEDFKNISEKPLDKPSCS